MPDDHISEEQFLIEFFGNFGRDLGNPKQFFTDNPQDILEFVKRCAEEKKPAFISVQPRKAHRKIYGIEKIFYDFDYTNKSLKLTKAQEEKRKQEMQEEVKKFIRMLEFKWKILSPLIVKTRKGYHVYLYFDKVYEIDDDEKFWREVYGELYEQFLGGYKFKYVDLTSKNDLARLCRIPLSIHQVSGEKCILVDRNLKPTKIRSINFYRTYGLKREHLISAVKRVKVKMEKKKKMLKKIREQQREEWEIKHGYVGEIRPCFLKRMEEGEMCHQQRLALLIEAFYSGKRTEDELVELFRCFNDFNERITRTQVQWFLKNLVKNGKCTVKPYRCSTIQEYGWCLGEECPTYRKRKRREKNVK